MKKIVLGMSIIILISGIIWAINLNRADEIDFVYDTIKDLYTVSDSEEFPDYIRRLVDLDSKQTTEAKQIMSREYSDICSEDGLNQMSMEKIYLLYIEAAYNGGFIITVESVEYEVYLSKVANESIFYPYDTKGYEYKVELLLEYDNGEKAVIYEEGTIQLVLIDDEWKIDYLKYKELNEVFEENLNR